MRAKWLERTLLVVSRSYWLQAPSLGGMVGEASYLRLMLTVAFKFFLFLNKFAVYKAPAVLEEKLTIAGLEFSKNGSPNRRGKAFQSASDVWTNWG